MPWDKRLDLERTARIQFVICKTHQQYEYWYQHWLQRSRPTAKDSKGHRMWSLQRGVSDIATTRHVAKRLHHFSDLQGHRFNEDDYDLVYTGSPVSRDHWTYDDFHFEELLFQVQLYQLATKTPRIHQE